MYPLLPHHPASVSQGGSGLAREHSCASVIPPPHILDPRYPVPPGNLDYALGQPALPPDLEVFYLSPGCDPGIESSYYLASHSQAFVTSPSYPQQGTQVTDAYSERTDAPYQNDPQYLPAPPRGDESCGPIYLGHMANGTSVGDQHWQYYYELGYDPEPSNWGQCPPGLEEASQPRHGNVEFQVLPDPAPATPMPLHMVDRGKHPGQLFSHPAGMEGNQAAALVPAGSSPVEPNNAGTQNANKRKRDTTPGEQERETIEPTQKKRRNSEAQEHVPAGAFAPLRGRPNLRPVPQTKYRCKTTQKGRNFLPPIDFTSQGDEGIKLTDAMNLNFSHLDNRDDLMFVDGRTGTSISLRISFVGRQSGSGKTRQIATKNHKRKRAPITRQKLGHDAAKLIGFHLEEGSPFGVPFESMYLVRLRNVSHASWQVELWYEPPANS